MNRQKRGFTLVEMLVVIAIIAILAAILVPTVFSAIVRAREFAIAKEVASMDFAVRQYKTTVGEYPPNFDDPAAVTAHLRQAFGKYDPAATGATAPPVGLDAAEALVFWLQGFSGDPKDPLRDEDRMPWFSFNESRLVDKDGDGFQEYYPPAGEEVPYVYFRFDAYATASFPAGATNPGTGVVAAYKKAAAPSEFVHPKSFQLISAGLDGDWGGDGSGADRLYPVGSGYGAGDRDNLANFSEGQTLGDAQE